MKRLSHTTILLLLIGCGTNFDPPGPVALKRIAPAPQAGRIIEVQPYEAVEFRYEVRNKLDVPLTKLRLQANCRCQIVDDVPTQLQPGETVEVALKITAGDAGLMSQTVKILFGEEASTLASFTPMLNVPVDVPQLRQPPTMFTLKSVAGGPTGGASVVHTMEQCDSAPWLTRAELTIREQVLPLQVEALGDGHSFTDVCNRTYRITSAADILTEGVHSGTVTIYAGDESVLERPAQATVSPAVSLIPSSLQFDPAAADRATKRITVIDRLGTSDVSLSSFDDVMLNVKPIESGGRLIALEVTLASDINEPATTSIVVSDQAGTTQTASVSIGPE